MKVNEIKVSVVTLLIVILAFGAGLFIGNKIDLGKHTWAKGNIFLVSPKADGKSFLTVPVKYDKKTGIVALDIQEEVKTGEPMKK
ncbi:MAG: hypothetical protein KAX30_04240 [Candidatus Atribacteria bacterium]|nr:hypothetical protein [Candidatus Atribacteria bacterium]